MCLNEQQKKSNYKTKTNRTQVNILMVKTQTPLCSSKIF